MPETFFFKQRKHTEEGIEKYSECVNSKVHVCMWVCFIGFFCFLCFLGFFFFFFLRQLKEIIEGGKRTLLREAREQDLKQVRGGASEKAMGPHSSTLAWKIPWTEEPGRLQSMGSRRVGHDWVTSLSLFTFMHWRRKWQPSPVFLPGESQRRGSMVGCRLWGHRVRHDWSNLAAAERHNAKKKCTE